LASKDNSPTCFIAAHRPGVIPRLDNLHEAVGTIKRRLAAVDRDQHRLQQVLGVGNAADLQATRLAGFPGAIIGDNVGAL
jgi:hypothetical protein